MIRLGGVAAALAVFCACEPAAEIELRDADFFGSDVLVEGDTLYSIQSNVSVRIWSLGADSSATQVGQLDRIGAGRVLEVVDGILVVLEQNNGLGDYIDMVDVTDPTAPMLVRRIALGDTWSDADLVGDRLYLTGSGGLFQILDVTGWQDATALDFTPIANGALDLGGSNGYDVDIEGPTAFVATDGGSVHLIDVADPAAPRVISVVGTGFAADVAVRDDLLYVVKNGLFQVVDVSDIGQPEVLSEAEGCNSELALVDDRAFTFEATGLIIYGIDDPHAVTTEASIDTGCWATAVQPYQADLLVSCMDGSGMVVVAP